MLVPSSTCFNVSCMSTLVFYVIPPFVHVEKQAIPWLAVIPITIPKVVQTQTYMLKIHSTQTGHQNAEPDKLANAKNITDTNLYCLTLSFGLSSSGIVSKSKIHSSQWLAVGAVKMRTATIDSSSSSRTAWTTTFINQMHKHLPARITKPTQYQTSNLHAVLI